VTAIAARDAGIPIAVQVPLCPVTDCRLGPQRQGTSFEHFAEGFLLTEVNFIECRHARRRFQWP
jgi:hypothetical protein